MSLEEFIVHCDIRCITKIALVSLSDNIKKQCKKLKIEKFQVKLPHYCKLDACIIDVNTLSSLVSNDIDLLTDDSGYGLTDYYSIHEKLNIVLNVAKITDGLKHERDLLMKRVNAINTALTLTGESV